VKEGEQGGTTETRETRELPRAGTIDVEAKDKTNSRDFR